MNREVERVCRAAIAPGERVCCAVSGGADSMALLHSLMTLRAALGFELTALHYNHHLRGAESDRDEAFLRDYCDAHAVPLRVGHGRVAEAAAERGMSLEQAARTLRYAFLEDAAAGGWILTAHTADDNLETMLLNLLRGTGLRGLGGIPPQRGRILRPMLRVTREMVLDYLARTGTPHIEDGTNAGDDPLRNRLRHNVIPLLCAEAPSLPLHAADTCAQLRADEQYLAAQTALLLSQAASDGAYSCARLREAPEVLQLRAARELLRRAGLLDPTRRHVAALRALCAVSDGCARMDLPQRLRAVRRYDRLSIESAAPPQKLRPVWLRPPCEQTLPGWRVRLTPLPPGAAMPAETPLCFAIPETARILIRPRAPGDSLRLPGGRKPLARLLTDRKIPADARDSLPVLSDGERLLGVCGIGRNLEFPLTGACVLVEAQKLETNA